MNHKPWCNALDYHDERLEGCNCREQPTSKDLTSEIREALHERSHWSAVEAASKFRSLLSYALVEIERLNADVDLVKAVSRADARSVLPWGDGTREMLIELRDWLRAKMPCNAGDCCNELRSWIDRVDKDITSHSPAASAHEPPAAQCDCPAPGTSNSTWSPFCRVHAVPPAVLPWGDGTREMLIELRDWLRSNMPCNAGDCCNELRAWIERVDNDITSHSPAASTQPPGALQRIADQLRNAGAALPAPEIKGTIESSMVTGLSIALCLVQQEIDGQRAEDSRALVPTNKDVDFVIQVYKREEGVGCYADSPTHPGVHAIGADFVQAATLAAKQIPHVGTSPTKGGE